MSTNVAAATLHVSEPGAIFGVGQITTHGCNSIVLQHILPPLPSPCSKFFKNTGTSFVGHVCRSVGNSVTRDLKPLTVVVALKKDDKCAYQLARCSRVIIETLHRRVAASRAVYSLNTSHKPPRERCTDGQTRCLAGLLAQHTRSHT